MDHDKGMTLIEVLIALAILGIALTAILRATTLSLRHSFYLQQKTVATWAGLEILEQIEAGIREAPQGGGTLHGESSQGGQSWSWDITRQDTATKGISRVNVLVSPDGGSEPLATLTGYLYAPRN